MSPTILETVSGFICQVIGEEWAHEIDITNDTSFNADLELESIEFVALAELIQEHYGDQIDFVNWLSQMELDEIIALRVGDLTGFIEGCL